VLYITRTLSLALTCYFALSCPHISHFFFVVVSASDWHTRTHTLTCTPTHTHTHTRTHTHTYLILPPILSCCRSFSLAHSLWISVVLYCVAVCCSMLQCAAMYCSVLQCVAVCCSVLCWCISFWISSTLSLPSISLSLY